jgi:hypothetical protein
MMRAIIDQDILQFVIIQLENQSYRVTNNIPINNVWLLLLGDKGQQLSKD